MGLWRPNTISWKGKMDQSQFTLGSYGSNLAATVTAGIFFGAAWVCKNRCKHSQFTIDSGCIKCSGDGLDTIRENPNIKKGGNLV